MMATDLDIVGTPADDHVTVVLVDGSFQSVQVGDNQLEFTSGDVKTVEYESGGGDDVLRLELGVHQAESSLDDRTSSQDSSIVDAALSQLDADNDNELTNRDMLTHANRHNAVMNRMLGQFGVNRDCTDAHDVVLTEFGTDVEISSTNGLVDRAQDALSEGPLVITESEAIADEQDVSEPATLELSTNDDETSAIAEPSHWAEPTLLSGGNGNIVVFGDANTIIVNPSSPSSVPSPSLPIFVQPPVPVPPDVNSPATTEPTPADVTAHVTLSGIGVVEVGS